MEPHEAYTGYGQVWVRFLGGPLDGERRVLDEEIPMVLFVAGDPPELVGEVPSRHDGLIAQPPGSARYLRRADDEKRPIFVWEAIAPL